MMLAGTMDRGKTEVSLEEAGYKVVAVMFFGKKEVPLFLERLMSHYGFRFGFPEKILS